ncbi:MAG: class I SAM-dependent methyltransferase, partial [Acidobacteriota bacterium]|nr:class I SAM-dependent methyltransferase [Acidobacteriota bacterium]
WRVRRRVKTPRAASANRSTPLAWFKREGSEAAVPAPRAAAAPPEGNVQTRAFPKFIAALARQESPVIVDFGPVIGSNVSFFGERLGCKIFVEDLYADIERHAKEGKRAALPEFLAGRLTQADESVDGVLCWDLFDFLDKPSAMALASRIAKMIRPGGAVFGYFGAAAADLTHYNKFVVVDEGQLKMRPFAATPVKRQVLQNRDIIKMFDPLTVAESFLLKSNTRETLFRRL